MFCQQCGSELSSDARFCDRCGRPVEKSVSTSAEPVRVVVQQAEQPPRKSRKHVVQLVLGPIFLCIGVMLLLLFGSTNSTRDSAGLMLIGPMAFCLSFGLASCITGAIKERQATRRYEEELEEYEKRHR